MVDKRPRGPQSPKQPGRKRRKIGPAPEATTILRLKIQRLRGDDFFISISKRDMITQLKQQVLRVLRSTTGPDVRVEITNIRLIYKGKVLADEKSIEFYSMQNEDTIQLVPFRRSRSVSQSGRESRRERRTSRQWTPVPNEVSTNYDPITMVAFTSSFTQELPWDGDGPAERMPSGRSRPANRETRRRRPRSSTGRRPRPVTSSSLLRFKDMLQRTHLRVHLAEQQRRRGRRQNTQRALLAQLQILIRRSLSLRDDLLAEFQSIANNDELPRQAFQATAENGVFSIVPRQERTPERRRSARLPSSDDQRIDSPTEEKKTEHLPSRSNTITTNNQSNGQSSAFTMRRINEYNILVNQSISQSNIGDRQNSISPLIHRVLHLSRADSPATPEPQRNDPLQSFISSILIDSSDPNNSQPFVINNGQGAVNTSVEQDGLSSDQPQPQVTTSSVHASAAAPTIANENSGQTLEQTTTTGSRLRNMFNQFLNRFIN